MKETMIEYRTTREIIEGIIRNCKKYSDFDYKSIYEEDTQKMYYCVKLKDSSRIYEMKITKKLRGETRIQADGISTNKDAEKQLFLGHLKQILDFLFRKVEFHQGNILISDNNNDYIISMVKKMNLEWK